MRSIRTLGKKSTPHLDPNDPPRRRANKQRGRGTYANDRPPIIHLVSRESGEHRFWVCDHTDKRTCHELINENIPVGSTVLYTDEANSYPGCHPTHGTVCHSAAEWARDDDGTANVRCIATVAKGQAQPCAHVCGCFAVSKRPICISMWPRMRRWSIPNV